MRIQVAFIHSFLLLISRAFLEAAFCCCRWDTHTWLRMDAWEIDRANAALLCLSAKRAIFIMRGGVPFWSEWVRSFREYKIRRTNKPWGPQKRNYVRLIGQNSETKSFFSRFVLSSVWLLPFSQRRCVFSPYPRSGFDEFAHCKKYSVVPSFETK